MLFLPLRGFGAAGVWLNGPDEAGHILTYNSVERTTYPIFVKGRTVPNSDAKPDHKGGGRLAVFDELRSRSLALSEGRG